MRRSDDADEDKGTGGALRDGMVIVVLLVERKLGGDNSICSGSDCGQLLSRELWAVSR